MLAEYGRSLIPQAHFYADERCLQRTYDLALASTSLHYAQDWRGTLERLASATAGYMFVTGLPMVERAESFVFVNRGRRHGYYTEDSGWCLNRDEFLCAAKEVGLALMREFMIGHRPVIHRAPEQNEYRGFLFQPNPGAGR